MVLAWIRLSSHVGFIYKRRILEEVGGLVGKVAKFDLNTDSKTRGHFARMVVFIDLDKPLASQVMVNGELQKVEYEALLTIFFASKKYGYFKDQCSSLVVEKNNVFGKVSGNVVDSTFGARDRRSACGWWWSGNLGGSKKFVKLEGRKSRK
ncbi:hypothetical protein GOBAR_AA39604 [Gossypium barbadense]|uniref:DUF4283 domain-containing protein n=1 Tax=Gossypium barbadense TaxID=3634 RepID=A0A2P5VQJ6_GOSBA|nr:hypothetical protein GOBAR_AA39604 [Gossypium barbadense]